MASDPKSDIKDYDLFAGCTIQNRIPFLEKSARFVFEKLGYTLHDKPYGCCPDPVGVMSTDYQTWLTLGARNLALSEKSNHPIVSLCNGCTETLKAVNYELKHKKEDFDAVKKRLESVGKTYSGTAQVKHFIELLHEDIGLEAIKALVVKPLTGLKITTHVGCHYSRPSEMMQVDDAMNPRFPVDICEALGATHIDYEEANLCCTSALARNDEEASNGLMKRKYQSILDSGAQIIVVNCPSCYQQLEVGQRSMKKAFDMAVKIPVMYVTELMALAYGASMKDIGLKFHQIKPMKLLKEFGFE